MEKFLCDANMRIVIIYVIINYFQFSILMASLNFTNLFVTQGFLKHLNSA